MWVVFSFRKQAGNRCTLFCMALRVEMLLDWTGMTPRTSSIRILESGRLYLWKRLKSVNRCPLLPKQRNSTAHRLSICLWYTPTDQASQTMSWNVVQRNWWGSGLIIWLSFWRMFILCQRPWELPFLRSHLIKMISTIPSMVCWPLYLFLAFLYTDFNWSKQNQRRTSVYKRANRSKVLVWYVVKISWSEKADRVLLIWWG